MISKRQTTVAEYNAKIEKAQTSVERYERLSTELARARGALKTLATLYNSGQRAKHARLERKRTEALGHCIATANAKVAYRHCKRTIAEVAGARELITQLEANQESPLRRTVTCRYTRPRAAACRCVRLHAVACCVHAVTLHPATACR